MEDIQNTGFTDEGNYMQDIDILSIDFDQNNKTGEEEEKLNKSDEIDLDQLLAEQQMLLKNSPCKKKPETNLNMVMQNLDINLKQIEKLQ